MKRFISRAVAVILTCVLAFGSSVCFAADSTESADAKKYYDYGTYVLLGDSVASGHNDLVYVDSEFKRVENSYGAYVADALGVNYVPMACPGFRTIDIRYMLEDDYPGDDYLFHDSHDPEVMKRGSPSIAAQFHRRVLLLSVSAETISALILHGSSPIFSKKRALAASMSRLCAIFSRRTA